jgi:hypothetical protein
LKVEKLAKYFLGIHLKVSEQGKTVIRS